MTIVDDDHLKSSDIFLMRSRSKILFITSFIHIVKYDETTHRKTETIINVDVDDVDSQSMLEIEKENEYESFHNEQNYAFAHWLHQSENIKKNVNSFFQNSRLKSFHEQLSFKNENQWLTQLSKISIEV